MRKTAIFAAVVAGLLSFVAKADACTATNVVVAPLIDTHWTQNAPYNDYSPKGTTVFPSGWEAGCVATAAAQELYYWQWPWRLDAVHETSHPVLNESNLSLRFDGSVPFDWESMQNTYGDGATLKQKHAVAHLVLACQSLVWMRFVSGGGEAMRNLPGTMDWFEYAGQVTPRESDANLAALREDFEWGSPVQTGINFKGYGGHEVVGLGYATGTNSVGDAKNLIWLNLGWGGGSDGWYDIGETDSSETIIKSVQLGFRPIKSVQIEPVAPISGNSVTLNWHLPNCYANKISGFSVAKKMPSASTTTWTDDFSTGGKGRSSNTNEMRVANGGLMAWDGTASAIYTWDEALLLSSDSILTYDIGSSYMSGMEARFEARFGNGGWQKIGDILLNSGRTSYYDNNGAESTMTSGVAINLGQYAGKIAQFRVAVEYTTGGTFANYWASMKIDNLSISSVKTFETVATDSTIAASARSTTFSGLTTGETYAFTVTPIMSDGSAAVTQTAATTIGTPAASPVINSVSMSPAGTDLVQEGFYTDIAMGWNVIDVNCSESVTSLEAYPSHQSVLPQSKVEVVNNGSGSFSINIDATEVAAKWANQKMILTLKATNATGESAYKDVELCLKASGVPENVPGGKTWTGASALYGSNNYTAKWTDNVLPVDGDKVTFLTTDAEFGGEMNLNLSTPTALGYVLATGDGQLTISGTASELLTAEVLKNDIQVEINSSKFKVNKAVPSANIVIDSGSSLDCEIDQSRSGYVKKVSGGYVSALTDSSLWKGTVVFAGYTANGLNFSSYGNTSSFVRLNGVSGYLAYNTTFNPTVELVDSGTTPALDWNNGSGSSTATFKGISGYGTFKTSGSGGAAEKIVVNDIDGFTGAFNLASKVVTIGTTKGTDASNGRLNFNSGYGATIAGGKTWAIGGGVYLAGNQTLTVNGTLADSGALAAEGTGTVLNIAPTGSVSAASLSFENNTIRLAMTSEASPTLSVTGAANLTGATIEVDRANGMPVVNSIALMTAGSFTGFDTATISGLEGYSLEADGGTLYAVKDDPAYTGPEPIAVWTGNFGSSAEGCSLALHDNSFVNGVITIADGYQGIDVNLDSGTNAITVIVKYTNLVYSSSNDRVVFASCASSAKSTDRTMVRLASDNTLKGTHGNNSSAASNAYNPDIANAIQSSGYMVFCYGDPSTGTNRGTLLCSGDSEGAINTTNYWASGLKFDADSTGNSIFGATIGGYRKEVSGWKNATGMKIEAIAVFTARLTAEEWNAYRVPAPTVVARFVNGGDSTDYTSLNDAMTALAVVLHSNPNSGAYVEVVDDGLETPNEYGSSGIGYSATERKYARAVAKLDNGTATYPAFLNLADAWAAAGKGADTATITILSAPSDSVTIEVGQTLKVEGLALAEDKVLVGENRIKYTATDNGVTTYTAKYTDAVTLLDGTIYHGNDANRAIITNYLSQMVGHRPVKMPAPSTVDLLLVYDPNAVAYATNHYSTIEEHAAHNVAVMNQALAATDIETNVWFRIAGIYQVDVAAAHVDDALSKLNSGTAEGWGQVNAMRDQVGADVVLGVVYTNSNYGLANWCSPTAIMNGSAANSAFAGVRADAAWAWVHEVGHVASLFHNPVEAANTYHDTTSIGCGFVKIAAADAAELRSLMNSGTAQMAFSSPNHMSHGEVYSVTNASGAWVDSSGELARLLPYMAKYRDTVVNAWTITPQSGSTVAVGDTMTVTCEDPEATIWISRDGLSETQYAGPVSIDTSSALCQYIVAFKKDGETVGTAYVAYTVDQPLTDAVAKIDGGAGFQTLQAAIDAAASEATVVLLKSSSEAIALSKTIVFSEGADATFTGTFTGSGTLKLGAFLKNSKTSSGVSPLAAGWTGTVDLTFAFAANGHSTPVARYGNANSAIKLTGGISGGWLANAALDTTIELAGDMTLSDFSTSFANTIKKLTGRGTFGITYSTTPDLSYQGYYPYYLIKDVSSFEGSLVVPANGTIGIVVGANAKPSDKSYGGKILVYAPVTASSDWTAPGGIALADTAATLTVEDGVTVSAVSTTIPGYGVVRNGNVYSVERVTDTAYPVPYSWFLGYGVAEGSIDGYKEATAANGQNTWWECYVLGLDPTNETSKFTATIRMDGVTPVVEYSPTNETLKANGDINYVLQGKPTLTNDWSDCPSFAEPGDTNRFFRVKVTWQE